MTQAHTADVAVRTDVDRETAPSMSTKEVFGLLLGTRKLLTVLMVGSSLVSGVAEAIAITLTVKAVGQVMQGATGPASLGPFTLGTTQLLWIAGVAVVLRAVTAAWAADLGARLCGRIREDMKNRLVRAYAHADWGIQARDRSGEFTELTTAQVQEATAIVLGGTQAIVAGTTLLALLATSAIISPIATVAIVALGGVLFALAAPMQRKAYAGIHESVESRGDVAADLESMCACTEEMHVYGAAEHFCERASKSIAVSEHSFYTGLLHGRMANALFQSATLLIIFLGAVALTLVQPGAETSTLGAVVILLMRGAGLAQQVQQFGALMGTQKPYVEKVAGELNRYESSWQHAAGAAEAPTEGSKLVIDHASFTYPGGTSPALQDVSLELGSTGAVGITGPSGSGKSTLVQLILGLRRPTAGAVTIGGVDVGAVAPPQRSKMIALVGQVPKLLPGTIAENIAFFRPLSREDLESAAERAGVLQDILALPDGFETQVGQRVDPISGGQRQRICIARALAAHPSILVLDEPTSSLDATSEQIVVDTLEQLARTMSVVIVSHREAPLGICDRILTVTKGRVAESAHVPAGVTDPAVEAPTPELPGPSGSTALH